MMLGFIDLSTKAGQDIQERQKDHEYGKLSVDFKNISPYIWLYEWTGIEA